MIATVLALHHRCALADNGRGVLTIDGHAQCARRWRAGELNLEVELGADQDLGPVDGINGLRLRSACDEQQQGADAHGRLWCHCYSPDERLPDVNGSLIIRLPEACMAWKDRDCRSDRPGSAIGCGIEAEGSPGYNAMLDCDSLPLTLGMQCAFSSSAAMAPSVAGWRVFSLMSRGSRCSSRGARAPRPKPSALRSAEIG